MAKFKFIGTHTGGRNSINASGVDFVGDEPSEVTDADGVERLRKNPEFEEVGKSAGGLEGINALRAQYRARYKKNPGPRWDEATLREKLAA
jgi:hypothetical protein